MNYLGGKWLGLEYVEWSHRGLIPCVVRTCGRPPRNKEIGDNSCHLASSTATCHMGSVLTKYAVRTRTLRDMKMLRKVGRNRSVGNGLGDYF